MSSVEAILSVYKRPSLLEMQLEAIQNQTVNVGTIHVVQNGDHFEIPESIRQQVVVVQSSKNQGVWFRLAYALMCTSDFIALFDDDAVPGKRWIENCLKSMNECDGLLGSRGLRFTSRRTYLRASGVGWAFPNDNIERVDIVGHAWFFRREWLSAFWATSRPEPGALKSGEDFHLSYSLQRVLGKGTFVPPHPAHDQELWGTQPEIQINVHTQSVGISMEADAVLRFQRTFSAYRRAGFELHFTASWRHELRAYIVLAVYRLRSWVRFMRGKVNGKSR